MPYKVVKHKDKTYSVINSETRKIFSRHSTLDKARKQKQLLERLFK